METVTTNVYNFVKHPTLLNFTIAFWPDTKETPFSRETAFNELQDAFFKLEDLDEPKSRLEVQLAIVKCIRKLSPISTDIIIKMLKRMEQRIAEPAEENDAILKRWFFIELTKFNQPHLN